MIRVFSLTFACCVLLCSCASSVPKPVTKSPVQTPAPVVKAEPVVQVDNISPEIKVMREHVSSGNYDAASGVAHSVVDASPKGKDAAEALRTLALISSKSGKYGEALLYADAAESAEAGTLENYLIRAEIAHRQSRDGDAVRLLVDASDRYPSSSEPHTARVGILISYLDYDRALDAAQKAISLGADNCAASAVYADALYAVKRYSEAASAYVHAIGICPSSGIEDALGHLAKIYEINLQEPAAACDAYTKLVGMAPSNQYYKASRDYQCGLVK